VIDICQFVSPVTEAPHRTRILIAFIAASLFERQKDSIKNARMHATTTTYKHIVYQG